MEGMQYIQHREIDGTYRAILYWKVKGGVVYIKEPAGWLPTKVPVEFVKGW